MSTSDNAATEIKWTETEYNSGFEPLGDKIIVLPDEVAQQYDIDGRETTIVRPDNVRDREAYKKSAGTVIAVGPNCWERWQGDNWCKPGDRVAFGRYAGFPFRGPDGKKYRCIIDADIMGKVERGVALDVDWA